MTSRQPIFLLALFLCLPVLAAVDMYGNPSRGYIHNDLGNKCWYRQVTKPDNTYFHSRMTSITGIMTFDDPACMSDNGAGLDINLMLINNVVAYWYSHDDADFQTRVSDLYPGSYDQVKGKCTQSKKYPVVGVTIDYIIENGSIVSVIHGISGGGCTD